MARDYRYAQSSSPPYFEIDVEIVWAVVTQDLPSLLPDIERLITAKTLDTP
ncbi:hypothetical protein [Leptolyngbya iicbica]|uniref:hypothetical protein n=1 Tax=Leptolyngbya iicbica TaxID=3161580 RepID=UPI001F330B41|nr:hypothetical protein [Leptolyngbya sp. LK]